MDIVIALIGALAGYLIASFISGKEAGADGRLKPLKFKFKNYVVHFHHWFLMSVVLIMLWFFNIYSGWILGFVTGTIIQGLTYRDFYRLVYKKREEID